MELSLAKFKVYKSIPATNTKEDSQISQVLQASASFIEKYCQRKFTDYFDEETIETHAGSMDEKVFVKEYPIVDLIFEYSEDGGKTYTLATEFTEYFVGGDYITSGTTYPLYNPLISHNAIKLTYTAGYEDLPNDLEQAGFDLAQYFIETQYNPKSSLGANMVERSNKDGADITALPAHVYRVLSNYRSII